MLDQDIINELVFNLKHIKYKNIIQNLNIECKEDERGLYVDLILIKIKKSQRSKGYGSAVLYEIIKLANTYNVRVKLWVTNVFGSDLKRLFEFYEKHGFIIQIESLPGNMIYYPKKIK